MDDSSVVGVLAETLAEHRPVGFGKCHCGWFTVTELGLSWREKHEAHVASVVAALPNIAIVELPEPDAELGSWWDNDVTAVRGSGRVRLYLEDSRLVDSDARDLAAALLAASRRAARAAGGQA